MKVSLIITTYNSPELLDKVVRSSLFQIRLPDEVIIADDGSDDITAAAVQQFFKVSPVPMFHVWQEKRGFRAAKIRNEAIKQSSGDYIVLLDGDCVVNRHFIADHISLAEKGYFIQGKRVHISRDAVSKFNHRSVNSTKALCGMVFRGEISNIHHLVRLPHSPCIRNRRLRGIKSCNMSFFRQDIIAVNGFNEDFVEWGNEDSELACRFFRYGLRMKLNNFMAVCFHLWHPTNKTFTNVTQKLLEATLASKEYVCKNGLAKL
ncbi:MAG TPA: glycosyltransferase family 2 protein [Thermodesulfovibrionales bacterium]|nr:glycosyltransferase family 2 protein [Thermodesulfovibrionales bacterium]